MTPRHIADAVCFSNEELGVPKEGATREEILRFRGRKAVFLAQMALNTAIEQAQYCGIEVWVRVDTKGDQTKVVCNVTDTEFSGQEAFAVIDQEKRT